MKKLNTYNSITSQRPHLWIPQPWESGFHHMKFLRDTEFETIADTSMNWLHPAVAVFTHTALHPHFLHHLATIPYILSLWVSQVQVSQVSTPSHIQPIQCFTLPLLRPRGPTRKHQCVHFCKVPPLSLSGSLFLGLCWNRVDGNEMGKFWHHWLTWCSCSLLLVQTDWSEILPDWQVFLLWDLLVIFQDFQVGYHQLLSFLFNQGNCSGTHSSPPAVVTAASLFPSLCKHHLEKIKWPTVSCLLADPQETHVSYTLWTIEWQKYWCASVPCLGALDNCPTDQKAGFKNKFIWEVRYHFLLLLE